MKNILNVRTWALVVSGLITLSFRSSLSTAGELQKLLEKSKAFAELPMMTHTPDFRLEPFEPVQHREEAKGKQWWYICDGDGRVGLITTWLNHVELFRFSPDVDKGAKYEIPEIYHWANLIGARLPLHMVAYHAQVPRMTSSKLIFTRELGDCLEFKTEQIHEGDYRGTTEYRLVWDQRLGYALYCTSHFVMSEPKEIEFSNLLAGGVAESRDDHKRWQKTVRGRLPDGRISFVYHNPANIPVDEVQSGGFVGFATEDEMNPLVEMIDTSGPVFFATCSEWYDQHIVMKAPRAKEGDRLYHLRARYRLLSVPGPVARELEAVAVDRYKAAGDSHLTGFLQNAVNDFETAVPHGRMYNGPIWQHIGASEGPAHSGKRSIAVGGPGPGRVKAASPIGGGPPIYGESDIYKAPMPQRPWWVMVDGRNLVNYGYFSYLKTSQFPNQSSGALKRCTPDGFAWRNGYLYVRLPGGADPSTADIEFSCPTGGHTSTEPEFAEEIRWAPDSGFDVPGVGHLFSRTLANITVKADHVVIEGLRLHMGVGAAVVVHGNEVTVRDCHMSGTHMGICQPDSVSLPPHETPGERPITPSNRTSRGLTVEYCEFSGAPGYESCKKGFWGGLYAANTSAVFMNYGGPRSIVRHNWVYDSSQDHLQPRGNGTRSPEDASEIAYNLIQNCGDDPIEFDSASPMNLRVHHNVVLEGLCMLSVCPVMGGGLTVDHNIFYNSPENGRKGPWLKLGTPWGKGLPTRGMRLVHNTVVQPRGVFQWFGKDQRYEDNVLENNIIYVIGSQSWGVPDFPLSHHNLYCGPKTEPQHLPELIHAEQPFVSLKPIDFHLRPDSAAVDAGTAGKNYHHEARGKAPDLGAIELGDTWQFPRPGPRWATGDEIPNRPTIPASLPRKWVGLE